MSDTHEKSGNPDPKAPVEPGNQDLFTESHIEHLADLISEDDSSSEQETGSMSSVDLDDTGRFDSQKT